MATVTSLRARARAVQEHDRRMLTRAELAHRRVLARMAQREAEADAVLAGMVLVASVAFGLGLAVGRWWGG